MSRDLWPGDTAQTFSEVLDQLGEGTTNQELYDELRALVVRVCETGKKGGLTLTLSVELTSQNTISIVDKISVRKPEYTRPNREFQADPTGRLIVTERQDELFTTGPTPEPAHADAPAVTVGIVDPTTGEVVDATTGEILDITHP